MSGKNQKNNDAAVEQKFDVSVMSDTVSNRIDTVYGEKKRPVVFDGAQAIGTERHVISSIGEHSYNNNAYFGWKCSEMRKQDGEDVNRVLTMTTLAAYASNKGNSNLKWDWGGKNKPENVFDCPSGMSPSATAAHMGNWLKEADCHVKIVGRVRDNFGNWIYAWAPAE